MTNATFLKELKRRVKWGKISADDVREILPPLETNEIDEGQIIRESVIVGELTRVIYWGQEFSHSAFRELLRELGIFSYA